MGERLAVKTVNLSRTYKGSRRGKTPGTIVALNGVDLQVREGELFGLLGPNGAGKTTLIKILTTLLLPTGGSAYVNGVDVAANPKAIRPHIAMVSGGEQSGYGILTVREQLWMFSQFYNIPGKEARRQIDDLLSLAGLMEQADRKIYSLSTGMRQKVNFCRGLISRPKILFLDEPTLGLDVGAARALRTYTKEWIRSEPGRSVLLTTHYMLEADELCERVAIIANGRLAAEGSPSELKQQVQQETLLRVTTGYLGDGVAVFAQVDGTERFTYEHHNGQTELLFFLRDDRPIAEVLRLLSSAGKQVISLQKSEPTLEDVFLKLVGRRLRDENVEDVC